MIYQFRIDKSQRSEILRRLKEEDLLSQGWGGGETGAFASTMTTMCQSARLSTTLPLLGSLPI